MPNKEQKQTHLRLSQIARRTSNLVVITDPEQRVEWVNDAFTRVSGYTLEEVRGHRIGPFLQTEQTDQATVSRIRAALAKREPVQAEILNQGKSGDPYWLQMSVEPLYDDAGNFTGFMAVETDITEHKRLSDELLAQTREADAARKQLADAIQSLDDGFAIYDKDDRLVLCNPRFRELYSVSAIALVPGNSFTEIVRYGIANGQFLQVPAVMESWIANRTRQAPGKREGFECTLPDGRILRIVERITPNGERIGIHSDITDLKRAEKRLLDVIEGAQACTWEWNIKSGEQFVNDAWAEMLGYSLSEVGPLTYDLWRSFVHPDDIADSERSIEACFQGVTDAYRAEYRQLHKAGHWIWLLDRGQITARDGDGKPTYMVGVQFEISEQKAREFALTEAKSALEQALADRASAEQRFTDIAAVSDGWFWEQDSEFRFIFHSKEELQPKEELQREKIVKQKSFMGKSFREWLNVNPDVESSADWKGLIANMARNTPFRNFIYRGPMTATQDERWFCISGAPVFDPAGIFTGYCGVGAEVTELVLAKARAEEASRTKSMFLANMSHEIRTPLNGVLGVAEVLEASLSDASHKKMIGTIRRSGESLLNILNDILDMSKVEAGKMTLEAVPFRLDELAERVKELHSLRAEEKGIAFEVIATASSEVFRLGDAHRVQQILHNLISNAIKFTEEGGVSVNIHGDVGSPVLIEVCDTGIGMDSGQVARLHDEFSQGDNSITRRFGGTGLGMAITRRLIEMMGGTVTVCSELNDGTTVRVVLPLPVCAAQVSKTIESTSRFSDLTGLSVLAADDNATNRTVLEMMLKRRGAKVTLVANGLEALQALAQEQYDVVLLDIAMPVMDGPTALRRIRSIEEVSAAVRTPVIAVTANVMSHQVAEYIAMGFDACVAQPLNSHDLSVTILSLILQS